ncbi:MAG: PP2C family serine/threonine-protein phosphatase [Planctomycetota bacterium]
MTFDHAALFGEDHADPNQYAMHGLASGHVWCAISLGGPTALRRKGDAAVPNEDALCMAECGDRVLLAVADGHFGHAASHDLIERIDLALEARGDQPDPLPRSLDELYALIESCAVAPDTAPPDASGAGHPVDRVSETTLVVAIFDRAARRVWGVSVGDSSAIAVGLDAGVRWLTTATRHYAAPSSPASLSREHFTAFEASLAPGELLAVFTDGVNECEYGSPETSISARHFEALAIRVGRKAETFVEALAELALAGVDGHPGGEDNIAVVAIRVT